MIERRSYYKKKQNNFRQQKEVSDSAKQIILTIKNDLNKLYAESNQQKIENR